MSVTVNLLPPEIAERSRAKKVAAATVAGVLVWGGLLGVVQVARLGDVAQARGERDDAAAAASRLQSEVVALAPYQNLGTRLEARNAVLASAMEREIAWSRVLSDLSVAFPASSSLLTLSATQRTAADPATAAGAATTTTADPEAPVADIQFTGYTTAEYAPGLRDLLVSTDGADGFVDATLASGTREERGGAEVTSFTGSVSLDPSVLTHRYDEGLPPEVTP